MMTTRKLSVSHHSIRLRNQWCRQKVGADFSASYIISLLYTTLPATALSTHIHYLPQQQVWCHTAVLAVHKADQQAQDEAAEAVVHYNRHARLPWRSYFHSVCGCCLSSAWQCSSWLCDTRQRPALHQRTRPQATPRSAAVWTQHLKVLTCKSSGKLHPKVTPLFNMQHMLSNLCSQYANWTLDSHCSLACVGY